jgi:hypothetical protein
MQTTSPSPCGSGFTPCSDSVSLWLHPLGLSRAACINSLAHSSIGTPSRIAHYVSIFLWIMGGLSVQLNPNRSSKPFKTFNLTISNSPRCCIRCQQLIWFRLIRLFTPRACTRDDCFIEGSHYSKKNCHTLCNPLRLLVGIWFQIYFTALPGCFSPFPHGTCSLSV